MCVLYESILMTTTWIKLVDHSVCSLGEYSNDNMDKAGGPQCVLFMRVF